jgi:hypothetical protein
MTAVSKILAGGIGLAVLAGAAPAAAQYYPGGGYGGYGGNSGLGAIIEALLGGNRYANGVDQRQLVNQCIAAVTSRLERGSAYGSSQYGYGSQYGSPYGGYSQPGYGGYGQPGYGGGANARVLGVTSIEPRYDGLRVRGTATANAAATAQANPYGGQYGRPYGGQQANPYGQYGNIYGYGVGGGGGGGGGYGGGYAQAQPVGELSFKCNIDRYGRISDIDVDQAGYAYGDPYRRY